MMVLQARAKCIDRCLPYSSVVHRAIAMKKGDLPVAKKQKSQLPRKTAIDLREFFTSVKVKQNFVVRG